MAAAGLARASDVEHERSAGRRRVEAARARAGREAAARLEEFRAKLDAMRRRLIAGHAQVNALVGLLRYYLLRLRRAEAELAGRAIADRRLRLQQLNTAIRMARRRGVSPAASDCAARLASISTDYGTAVARWRAGDLPPDIRRVTLGHLDWAVPAATSDPAARRVLDRGQLPLDSLATTRQFAVGGAMLDIGAGVGVTAIPRILLGDFTNVYAAEPDCADYLCLVGNVLEHQLEGRVLPERVALAGSTGPARRSQSGTPEADVPSLTIDAWTRRLGIAPDDVRLVRVALRDWNLNVLDGAAALLKRRHIVWQMEIPASLLASAGPRLEPLASGIARHFTNVKELGRYWADQWVPAADAGEVLRTLADQRRGANLLLFNLRSADARKRAAATAAAAQPPPRLA